MSWCCTLQKFAYKHSTLRASASSSSYSSSHSLRASSGDTVSIHYVGQYYTTDEVFDSSRERNEPLTLVLGEYLTHLGLEKGLLGACIGEIRKITIPIHMTEMGEPDNKPLITVQRGVHTLVYTVEVLDIDPTSQEDDDGF